MRRVRVDAGGTPYDVLIGLRLLEKLDELLSRVLSSNLRGVFLIVDSALPPEAVDAAAAALARVPGGVTGRAGLAASEEAKSLRTVEAILVTMARARVERGGAVVVVGGGVVGDVGGFVAAVYRRGVPVVQCPTTLLAMVDAAVGGKTGVNLDVGEDAGLVKNLVGVFHQPRLVVADLAVLASLPERTFRSGLAECVKHGLLGVIGGDPGLLTWTEANAAALSLRDPEFLEELVARNIALKATIVSGDAREEARTGGRELLNLGHTFAHAIETLPGLTVGGMPGPLTHGEAVALGLAAACATGSALGVTEPGLGERVERLLSGLGLPTRVRGLPGDEALIGRMRHDKKVRGGLLRIIVPDRPGSCRMVEGPPESAVRTGLGAMRDR